MKLLIDANVLLDVLQKREPHCHDSSVVWKLCETEQTKGYVSALTIANIIYVMRKELTPKKIEETLKNLMLIFELTDLSTVDMIHVAEMKWEDFEDALQSTTAERIHADYIITRNIRDFRTSKIMALTPGNLSQDFENFPLSIIICFHYLIYILCQSVVNLEISDQE